MIELGEKILTLKEILIIIGTPLLFVALHYLGELIIKRETRKPK